MNPTSSASPATRTGALDKWLANPQAVAKGSKMVLQVADAKQRQAIIAYLATLK